jgi:hypothetical protein
MAGLRGEAGLPSGRPRYHVRMRAIGVIALSLALVASAASAANRPVLRVSDLAPLTVHGVRFKPSEHLRVVVTTKRRYVRRLDATDNGAFTLKMRLVRVRRCGQYSVVVYGPAGGMRAAVKSPPQSCGPDRTP